MRDYRTLILILLFLIIRQLEGFSQASQQLVTIPMSGKGYWTPQLPPSYQGYIYLPADYATSNKRYPVILFGHGSSTNMTFSQVLANGLPYLISNGMRPDNIINPSDGKTYSFIVLSLYNAFDPAAIPGELRWLNQHYRVDNTRIYLTGLSAGGYYALLGVTYNDSVSRLITASVPMSPPDAGNPLKYNLLNTYRTKTWFFAGTSDPFTNPGSIVYHNNANTAYPGSSTLTLYSGGHGGWNTYYNINYKDPSMNMSIYQWMLTMSNLNKFPVLPVQIKSVKLTRKS